MAAKTRDEILTLLTKKFQNAAVIGDFNAPPGPAYSGDREIYWIGVRFVAGDTCYVGITREAEDHPQNLGRQLEESIDRIAPSSREIVILEDRSGDSRYDL